MMEAMFIIIFNFQSEAQRKLSVSHVLLDLTQLKHKLVISQRMLDRPNGWLVLGEARITLTPHLTKCCGHIKEESLRYSDSGFKPCSNHQSDLLSLQPPAGCFNSSATPLEDRS